MPVLRSIPSTCTSTSAKYRAFAGKGVFWSVPPSATNHLFNIATSSLHIRPTRTPPSPVRVRNVEISGSSIGRPTKIEMLSVQPSTHGK
jgi:hypothetical protein